MKLIRHKSINLKRHKSIKIIVVNELVSDSVSIFRRLFRIERRDTIINLSKIYVSD